MSRFFRYDSSSDCVVECEGHLSQHSAAKWPLECVASGVAPQQASELREFFQRRGESVEVTQRGNPIYTSPGQRKRLLKLRGLHDLDS